MYPVATKFHELAIQDAPRTRCRIYFIPDTVDCTDDNDVEQNGTLLVGNAGDTDSNGRISSDGGVTFSDMFNSDLNLQIGSAVSKPVHLALLNKDNALNNFAFGRCKIYIDVYDKSARQWLACPIGVFIIDLPVKRNAQVVSASGYDQMQLLDIVADAWWSEIDFSAGVTVYELIQSIATQVGVSLNADIQNHILNGSKTYYESPINATGKTLKDILAELAGVTGTIAYFDRDGALDMKWFSKATVNNVPVTINGATVGNQCLDVDVAEYSVTPISAMEILSTDTELSATVGDGANVYTMSGNPFYTGDTWQDVADLANPVFNRLSSIATYTPSSETVIADWSVEAGDIVYMIYRGNIIPVIVMQQTINWRGSNVFSEIVSSGNATRPTQTKSERKEYANAVSMHEFEVTAEQLRSMIRDLSGNYTLIQQTVDSIQQTVSAQGITINDILDPTGEIWTAITTNSTNLSGVESALNSEISTRQSYIRFIPAEPAIVLGVDTGNEIKLKLVNNVIYFFNGADDSTDLSLAYAYFNSEESGSSRFIASESVQIGDSSGTAQWVWKVLSNGDLVLDLL